MVPREAQGFDCHALASSPPKSSAWCQRWSWLCSHRSSPWWWMTNAQLEHWTDRCECIIQIFTWLKTTNRFIIDTANKKPTNNQSTKFCATNSVYTAIDGNTYHRYDINVNMIIHITISFINIDFQITIHGTMNLNAHAYTYIIIHINMARIVTRHV